MALAIYDDAIVGTSCVHSVATSPGNLTALDPICLATFYNLHCVSAYSPSQPMDLRLPTTDSCQG